MSITPHALVTGAGSGIGRAIALRLAASGAHLHVLELSADAGEETAQLIRENGGTATVIGMLPYGTKIELNGLDLLRERRIQGSVMGSNRFRTDMPRLIQFYQQGRLHLDRMISGHIKLEQINEGFAAMKKGGMARHVIQFNA